MSNLNDAKIKVLQEKIEKQKESMGSRPRAAWITNGLACGKNINVLERSELVEVFAFLRTTAQGMKESAEILGYDEPIIVHGYPIESWEEDFKNRMNIINWNLKKNQLNQLESKLQKLMSEDARTAKELENIESLLA
jgi:hypothetical protein